MLPDNVSACHFDRTHHLGVNRSRNMQEMRTTVSGLSKRLDLEWINAKNKWLLQSLNCMNQRLCTVLGSATFSDSFFALSVDSSTNTKFCPPRCSSDVPTTYVSISVICRYLTLSPLGKNRGYQSSLPRSTGEINRFRGITVLRWKCGVTTRAYGGANSWRWFSSRPAPNRRVHLR